MSSCSILNGALHITCSEQGMTVQARLCPEEDFEDIAGQLSQKKGVKVFLVKNFETKICPPGNAGPCC